MKLPFVPKLIGWVLVGRLIGLTGGLTAPVPETDGPSPGFAASVLADFDEDTHPDLALARYERRGYRIEVHLSRKQREVSLRVPAREWGMVLLALDVNRDAHLDLVAANAHLVRPLAIWLGDGYGRFQHGRVRGWVSSLLQATGYTKASARGSEVSLTSEGRWPFDHPLWRFAKNVPEESALFPAGAVAPDLLLPHPCFGRSPPEGPVPV
ncbi:hypothetical protein HRbin08_00304 [bacterium HR08]|nr:hypothetical protein HRbin08_00304 [bacterium HR08]